MREVRIAALPFADFLETNLRTYVHAGGVPGVWFFSLDAESRLAVWGARTLYRLPYFHARMASASAGAETTYSLERLGGPAAALEARWTVLEREPHHAEAGTLEHFLTERYALYGQSGGRRVFRVRVHHPRWPLQRARLDRLSTTLLQAAGLPAADPIELVLASPRGVAVETFAREAAHEPRAIRR